MLRRHHHVEPHLGARSVFPPLEKQQNSIKRVGKCIAPRVADEPRRFSHMLCSVAPRHQPLRHAAAAAPRERAHIQLAELRRRHAAQ